MIKLHYGSKQLFRYRHGDINILGDTDAFEVRRSVYRLNGAARKHFYIEPEADSSREYAWGSKTPSILRLNHKGEFNIEIPIRSAHLQEGENEVEIEIEAGDRSIETATVEFNWNPEPVPLPIEMRDLSEVRSAQQIGQAVNSVFRVDSRKGVIRSSAPAGSDALFLIGSPGGSQEATYDVTYQDGDRGYAGLGDFFGGHIEQSPGLGIKPGYCTAGLAALSRAGQALLWMAYGDCLTGKDDAWVHKNPKPTPFKGRAGATYRVRHQVFIEPNLTLARFKLWPREESEPDSWLCELDDASVHPSFDRVRQASFGLFQSFGESTEWSNISVKSLEVDAETRRELKSRSAFLRVRWERTKRTAARIKHIVRNR